MRLGSPAGWSLRAPRDNVKQKHPSVSFAKGQSRSATTAAAAARRRLKCCQEHFRGGARGACSQWGADEWGRVGERGSAVSPLPASSGPAGRMWRETHSGWTVRNTAAEHNVHVVQSCAAPCCLTLVLLKTPEFCCWCCCWCCCCLPPAAFNWLTRDLSLSTSQSLIMVVL